MYLYYALRRNIFVKEHGALNPPTDMPIKVYFDRKEICFSTDRPSGEGVVYEVDYCMSDADALIRMFETADCIWVRSDFPQETFDRFSRGFSKVDAAGGVVRRQDGVVMMIHRRGRWDLPKGHVEKGETFRQAAVREVEEECGLSGVRIVRHITDTRHIYNTYGKWEMKLTRWFEMRYDGYKAATPQAAEDIVKAEWLSGEELRVAIHSSYKTIEQVIEAL